MDVNDKLLTVLRKTKAPKYFIFVDTETLPEQITEKIKEHKLRLGWCIFVQFDEDGTIVKEKAFNFTNDVDFWLFVRSWVIKVKSLHIISHNLIFDMTIVKHITYLETLGLECTSFYENGFTVIEKWESEEYKITLLNNGNWFPMKLAVIGKAFGIDKLDVDYMTEDLILLSKYCYTDVTILVMAHQFIIKYLYENDMGQWSVTIPSLALKIFRHKFMKHEIYLPRNEQENKLAREAYKGGRTECFYVGNRNDEIFYKLDVNSMYPFVMMNNEYPSRLLDVISNYNISLLPRLFEKYTVIADCNVNTKFPIIPHKLNGKTCYPIGRFRTVLTTPELKLVHNSGGLEHINTICVYYSRDIFTDFVTFFYAEKLKWKEQNNEALTFITKLLLNSLYGKFGQTGTLEKVIGQAELNTFETTYNIDRETGERSTIKQIGTNIIEQSKSDTSPTSFVAIAAHVTAYARIYLYQLIYKAGNKNIFYCDTDSLIVNQKGLENLSSFLNNDLLGMLKIEKISNEIEIIAPKHYILDNEIRIKGIPKDAIKNPNGTYTYYAWPKFNKIRATGKEIYFNYQVIKELKPIINYGEQQYDGFIKPFEINEL